MASMELFLVIVLGFLPPILSILAIRRLAMKSAARLRSMSEAAQARSQLRTQPLLLPADTTYVEGIGFAIGDLTCRFNARSAHVRCAVNPDGPCQSCRHYELVKKDF